MKLVNVAMSTAEAFNNIFMYLYKNILEYGQIARNGTKSMLPDTEGRSISLSYSSVFCASKKRLCVQHW